MPDSSASPLGEPTPLPPAIEARLDALLPPYAEGTAGHSLRAALSAEIGRYVADSERLDFLHRQREAVHARPYTLTMHLTEYQPLRERIDLDMKYAAIDDAARSTPRPPSR